VDLGYLEPDPAALTAITNAQRIAQETLRTKENKAKFWIQNSVDDSIFSKIIGPGTSKQAWDILKTSYQGNDRVKIVKLQSLWTQFETLRMTESETVDQFMTRVMGIVNQIRLIGETITDQRIVEKILRSLPKKFEMVVTTILESKDLSRFSTDELIGSLVTHGQDYISQMSQSPMPSKLSSHSEEGKAEEEVEEEGTIKVTLIPVEEIDNNIQITVSKVTEINNKINIRISSLKEAEGEDQMTNPAYNAITAKSMVTMNLRKMHIDKISGKAHVSNHTGENSGGMFLSCHNTKQQPKDLWLLDSGCSNHMTGNKELLSSLDSSISSDITLGNDNLVNVQGKGTVPILTKQNVNKDICNVYHVPDLKHNLLSVGHLIEEGYKVLFEGASCKIYDRKPSRKLISEIYMTPNRLFPLTLRTANLSQPYAQSASTLNETMIWHTRFGHLPFQSLSLLQKNSMVKGLPIFKEQIPPCESCILGKHKRTSFPESSNQAK
jgi:hypothetical protein